MKIYTKALLAGLFTVAIANSASAQVRFGVYAGDAQPYYAPVVPAQPEYVTPPNYYEDQDRDVVPAWRARQEWRERQEREWRREQWQRQQEWRRQEERRRHEDWHRREEWHREHEYEHDARPYDQD